MPETHWYVVTVRYWPGGEMEDKPGLLREVELRAWTAADAVTQVQLKIRRETAVIEAVDPVVPR